MCNREISGMLGYSFIRALTDDKDPKLATEVLREAERRIEPVPGSPEWLLLNGGTRFDPRPGKGILLKGNEDEK